MALKMQTLQSQGVTGLRHLRPSDDPTETHSIIRLRAQLSDQEVYQENAELSMMYLSTAESSMNTASDIMNSRQMQL